MRETDIIEGVQNYVINWAQVKKGEHILVVADSVADKMVVDLIAAVARGQGADVVVAWIDYNPRQTQGAGPIIAAAMQGTDKVLRLTFAISHDTESTKSMQEYGAGMYGVANGDPTFFASEAARFPVEVTVAILKRTLEIVWREKVSTVRVTDSKGTDFRAKGYAKDWGSDLYAKGFTKGPSGDFRITELRRDMPGVYPRTFPGTITGLLTPFAGEGVTYFDAYSAIGICREPLKLTYKDNHCIHIEGGVEASKLKSMIRGIPGGNFLCEIMFGLNPKIRANAPLDQKPIPNEAERRAGNLHVGMGNRPLWSWVVEEMKNVKGPYRQSHLDGFVLKPTIYVNDKPIIENGHLTVLDDPEVREVAKKYGDPDEILAEAGPA